MSIIQIIAICYAALICIGLPFIIKAHKKDKNIAFEVIAIVFMPLVLLIGGFLLFKTWMQKDKALPVPKKIRNFIKPDSVSVNGQIMSLAEYNIKYNKTLTLKDVYGAKYADTIDENDIRSEESFRTLKVSDDVGSFIDTEFLKIFGEAFLKRDFSNVENLISEDATMVIYDRKTIVGAKNIVDYWKDWLLRCDNDKVIVECEVKKCKWFSLPALQISPKGYVNLYVILEIHNGLITNIMDIPNPIGSIAVGGPDLDWDRLEISRIRNKLSEAIDSKPNHISCIDCSATSETLKWYRVELPMGIHGYVGDISVCPHCDKIVEFIPEIRLRYEEPIPF
ncbi:MAG: hypothetical protein IKZ99_01690 [Salinivirgaceae bacterium]|nr:hypothetical protein [Salinivirgaceae bacterium]